MKVKQTQKAQKKQVERNEFESLRPKEKRE